MLKRKFKMKEQDNYPHHAIHILAENKPVNEHNRDMLSNLTNPLITIHALDQIEVRWKLGDWRVSFKLRSKKEFCQQLIFLKL